MKFKGEFLKQCREAQNMTVSDVAFYFYSQGLTRLADQTIFRWEEKCRDPQSPLLIAKLCGQLFKRDYKEFLEGEIELRDQWYQDGQSLLKIDGTKLKETRIKNGQTLLDVCHYLVEWGIKCSESWLSRIENNQRQPHQRHLIIKLLAQHFKVNTEDLYQIQEKKKCQP